MTQERAIYDFNIDYLFSHIKEAKKYIPITEEQVRRAEYLIQTDYSHYLIESSDSIIKFQLFDYRVIIKQENSDKIAYIFRYQTPYPSDFYQFIDNFQHFKQNSLMTQFNEFSFLEVFLQFVATRLNEKYNLYIIEYSRFDYQNHINISKRWSYLYTECYNIAGILDDILTNRTKMACLLFENYYFKIKPNSSNYSLNGSKSFTSSITDMRRVSSKTLCSTDNYAFINQIEDALDSYKTYFTTLLNEVLEMQHRLQLFVYQYQILYDCYRNYIVEFALKYKITNVSLTATSLIGAMFGQNFLFYYGFDNPDWTSISPIPFVTMLCSCLMVFFISQYSIMFNYRKRSGKLKKRSRRGYMRLARDDYP